jgi:hypothetical protein
VTKVIAELDRNPNGISVLSFFNLSPEHVNTLRDIMFNNGGGTMQLLRSTARAHVEYWTPENNNAVGIALYGDDPWLFVHGVCNAIGVSSGNIPNLPVSITIKS